MEENKPLNNNPRPLQTIGDIIAKYEECYTPKNKGDDFNMPAHLVDLVMTTFDMSSEKFIKMFNESCDGDYARLDTTLCTLLFGIFNQSQIDKNLNLVHPVPFVDKRVQAKHENTIKILNNYLLSANDTSYILQDSGYKEDLIAAFEKNYKKSLDAFGLGISDEEEIKGLQ